MEERVTGSHANWKIKRTLRTLEADIEIQRSFFFFFFHKKDINLHHQRHHHHRHTDSSYNFLFESHYSKFSFLWIVPLKEEDEIREWVTISKKKRRKKKRNIISFLYLLLIKQDMLSFTVVSLLVTYTAIPREMSILRALLESLAVWSARVNVWYIIAMHKHQKIVSTLFIVPLSLSLENVNS